MVSKKNNQNNSLCENCEKRISIPPQFSGQSSRPLIERPELDSPRSCRGSFVTEMLKF